MSGTAARTNQPADSHGVQGSVSSCRPLRKEVVRSRPRAGATRSRTEYSLTFLLGGMLAGAAGLVYALYETNVWYFQGFKAGLIAFTAAVMGGIGNVRGAVLGGLIIGVIQSLSDSRLGPQWTEAVVFGYLIAIMVLRPRGLLGEETREAGSVSCARSCASGAQRRRSGSRRGGTGRWRDCSS